MEVITQNNTAPREWSDNWISQKIDKFKYRLSQRDVSNNHNNPNQNTCALAVAHYFDTAKATRYLHDIEDLVRSVRTKYTVRSRGSVKNLTIGKARAKLTKMSIRESKHVLGYIIRVHGHAILLDSVGKTMIDTDPRKRDRRKITHCYIVYFPTP